MAEEGSKRAQGNWKRGLVNLWQTSEERVNKYWLCRSLGASRALAARMRDWRLSKIERYFGVAKPGMPNLDHCMLPVYMPNITTA